MRDSVSVSYRVSSSISGARLLVLACVMLLSACTEWLPDAYRLEISQGNVISPEQAASVAAGMPKAEVRARLGEPVLQDPFHSQRWDYIFRFSPSKGEPRQSRLTVHFEDDIVVRIDDSDYVDPEEIIPAPKFEE